MTILMLLSSQFANESACREISRIKDVHSVRFIKGIYNLLLIVEVVDDNHLSEVKQKIKEIVAFSLSYEVIIPEQAWISGQLSYKDFMH